MCAVSSSMKDPKVVPVDSKNKVNYRGIALDLLCVGLIYFIAQLVAGFVMAVGGVDRPEEITNHPALVLNSYILAGVVVLGLTLFVMRIRKIDFSILKLNKFRFSDIGYALVGYVVYMVLALSALSALRSVPGLDLSQEQDLGLGSVTGGLLPLTFVALVVVPPIVEEILFRGFLYGRLKKSRLTPFVAALITSFLFGLVHGQVNVAVDTFVLSMVMIFMLEKRKSLWVTIIMHATKNLVAFLALFVFKIV